MNFELFELLLPDFCTNTEENNTDRPDRVQILKLTEVAKPVGLDKILSAFSLSIFSLKDKEKCAAMEAGHCYGDYYLNHNILSIKWTISCLSVDTI